MPSKRQMRRAQQRHGDIVFEQEVVGKHSKGRKKRKPKPASPEHLRKLRSLYLRADILVVPYSEKEVKELMQKARDEYDRNGLISTNTSLELTKAGKDVLEIERLWDELKERDVKPTFNKEDQKDE